MNSQWKMSLLKHKQKKRKIIYFGIYVILLIILLISFWGKQIAENKADDLLNVDIINPVFNVKTKKQIFAYLKAIQPLEDKFYELVDNNMRYMKQGNSEEYLKYLKEKIPLVDEIILDLSEVEVNSYMIENNRLFYEEVLIMRNLMLEEKLLMIYGNEKNKEKIHEYLEKYVEIAQKRRTTLKKIFNQYDVVYIDLGNRIKYKIK